MPVRTLIRTQASFQTGTDYLCFRIVSPRFSANVNGTHTADHMTEKPEIDNVSNPPLDGINKILDTKRIATLRAQGIGLPASSRFRKPHPNTGCKVLIQRAAYGVVRVRKTHDFGGCA
jgi:hypothetical protein